MEKSAVAKMLSFSVLICFCISAWFAGYLGCGEKSTPLTGPEWETYVYGFTRDFYTEELTELKNKAKGLNSCVGEK